MSASQRGEPWFSAAGVIVRLLLRPTERYLAQCISISTEPSAFVGERVHLGDTTNFLRAANFCFSAVCTAFLAEVVTLYLLGIGNLTEPYYWLFILVASIPFVLFSFLLVRACCPAILQGRSAPLLLPHRCGSFHRRCIGAGDIRGCRRTSCSRLPP